MTKPSARGILRIFCAGRSFLRGPMALMAISLIVAACTSATPTPIPVPPTPIPAPTATRGPDLAAANREGKVTVYAPGGGGNATTLKTAFEKAYPSIAVEVVQEPPSALPRFISEAKKDGGAADVIYSNEANLRAVVEQNVLASYVPQEDRKSVV